MDFRKVTSEDIRLYRNEVLKSASASTFDRKMFSLRKFFDWAVKEGYTDENPAEEFLKSEAETLEVKLGKIEKQKKAESPSYNSVQARIIAKLAGKPKLQKLAYNVFYTRPNWYKSYHSLPIANYFNYAILILLMTTLGFGVYNQFFKTTSTPLAYPTTLTTAGRYLSFQGRLTNNLGNPITTARNVDFKLYNASASGTLLWDSGACSITPDTDGIFSTLLGSSCGAEIGSSVFSENPAVWLGVTVGTDTEATPRVQIATVAYALNSQTLQGYPASESATANTIPAINSSGYLVLGTSSPKIMSTSGNFAIQGQTMTFTTPTASNGNITVAPDGTGVLNLTFAGAAPGGSAKGFVNATDANLTSGSLYYGAVASGATGYNLLQLQSGSTLTDKFVVDYGGNVVASGTINGLTISSGTISGGTWAGTAIGTGYGGTGQDWDSVVQGSIPYFSATGTMNTLGPGTSGYALVTQGAGQNPTWANAATLGTNYWQLNSGILSPNTISNSLNLGATATASATVHLAGTVGENSFINTGNVGIGTTNPTYPLHISKSGVDQTGFIIENPLTTAGSGISNKIKANNTSVQMKAYAAAYGTPALNGSIYFFQDSGTGGLILGTETAAPLRFTTNGFANERMTILSTGYVGIGTTSPTAKLDVNGNLNVSGYATMSASLALGNTSALAGPGNLNMSGNFLAGGTINGLTVSSGTISSGTWNGSLIGTQYGGTGQDWDSVAQGSIPYFSAAGTMNTLGPGTSGYALVTQGAGQNPTWANAATLGTNYWQLNNGALSPSNISNSLNLGATATASATVHLAGTVGENSFINTGKVGIGTTSPGAKLNILSDSEQLRLSYDSTHYTKFLADSVGNLNIMSTSGWNYMNTPQINNYLFVYDNSVANRYSYITGTAIALTDAGTTKTYFPYSGSSYINNGGNVGIGTTSPTAKLDINGNLNDFGSATISASFAGGIPLIVKGATSQTANLQEWRNSTGTTLSGIQARGTFISSLGTDSTNFFAGPRAGNTTTTATDILAIGNTTGENLTTGGNNTLIGNSAGHALQGGNNNTFIGKLSGSLNVSGTYNTGVGGAALQKSTSGFNVAIGSLALQNEDSGQRNTAIGYSSLNDVVSGSYNTAIGMGTLSVNEGSSNIALGYYAGSKQTAASNLLLVDNQTRADAATELTNSIIYGVMAATPVNQTLTLNANTSINGYATASASLAIGNTSALAGVGNINASGRITGTTIYQGANQVCDVSGNCSALGNLWRLNGMVLSPVQAAYDLTVGGDATGSAFQVFASTGNITTAGDLAVNGDNITSDGTLGILGATGLTLGATAGRVDVTTDLSLATGKAYLINGTSVLNATTLGSGVTASSLTGVGALASGSIASGFGTITTANTITGTTINGTTGINTGAGAGTQRITSAGNLTNIGTTQFNTQTYTWPASQTASGFLQTNGTGTLSWTTTVPATSVPFSGITSGTNTVAAMIVGAGASLNYTSTGTINASSLTGNTWAAPGAIGTTTAAAGNFTSIGVTTQGTGAFTTLSFTYATASGSLALGNATAALGPGHLNMSGNLTTGGNIDINGTTNDIAGTLNLSGNTLTSTGDLAINPAGGDVNIGASDNLNLTASTNLIFGGTTSLGETTGPTDSGAYLVGANDEFTYSASTNVQGVLHDLDTQLGTVSGSNLWRLAGNVLAPVQVAYDLVVGGTATGSAFQVYAQTGNVTLADLVITGGNINPSAALTIGDNGDTLYLNSSDWDIGTTGDMTGIGAISMNGAITGATGFNGLVVTPNTGVVTTGTWNGTAIGATYGGTGQTVYAVGDLLYANTTTTLNRLADIATGNVLISGGVNTAPSWGKVVLGTHTTGNYVSSIAGTANQITASASTGAVTLSIPSDFRASGTVNAVNGIYTGATAGTQRIDATGNLINIANISASGNATVSGSLALGNTTAAAGPGNLNMSGILTVPQICLSGDCQTTWPTGSISYWRLDATGKVLSPIQTAYDLTVGGEATSSSKFQIMGTTGNIYTANNTVDWTLNNAADALNFDANTLSLDALYNRVGIGTAAPGEKLEVTGNILASNNAARVYITALSSNTIGPEFRIASTDTGGHEYRIGSSASGNSIGAGSFYFYDQTYSAMRFVIDRNGLFGMGKNTPTAKLDVADSSLAGINDNIVSATSSAMQTGNLLKIGEGGTQNFTGNAIFADVANGGGGSFTGNFIKFNNKGTTAFVVDSLGNADIRGVTYSWPTAAASGILTSDGSGNLSWAAAGSGINHWQLGSNILAPINVTNDLAIGGNATGSAKFQIMGTTGNIYTANNTVDWTLNNTADALNFDANTLSIDALNNRVGIGTIGPDSPLDVLSTVGSQLRLTYTDGTVYTTLNTDSSGNFTIDATGTKTIITDDLQITGNHILDSAAATRVSLGATTTLTNTTTTLSGTTTMTASSLATLTTSASLAMSSTTGLTLGGNSTINGGSASAGTLRIDSTGNATKGNISFNGTTTFIDGLGNLKVGGYATASASLNVGSGNALAGIGNISYSNALLPGGAAGTSGYLLTSAGGGVNTWTNPANVGTNHWQLGSNILAPINITNDLAIGGNSTASAKFQIFGATGNATMSGNLTLGFGKALQSAYGPLTLNYKSGANTWAAGLTLDDMTGYVGIGTTTPNNLIQVAGLINFDNTDFNTKIGYQAGNNIVSGAQYNTFLGYQSGFGGSGTNAADNNTTVGYQALYSNTSGASNTAIGSGSLFSNTSGSSNIAIGDGALVSNISGNNNIALGTDTIAGNTTGYDNIGIGWGTLYHTTSSENVAIGPSALYWNTSGYDNVALGAYALTGTDISLENVAVGAYSLANNNLAGNYNTALGSHTLSSLTTGATNIALGHDAGDALTTGSNNIILGNSIDLPTAGTSNMLDIGNLIYATGLNGSGTTLSSGNVGIGTTTPGSKLDIVGSSSVATVSSTNLLTADGTFTASTGWTLGSWTIGSGVASHASGTTALSGTSTATSTSIVYQVNFTVTSVTTAGDGFTVSLGGVSDGVVYKTTGAKTLYINPSDTTGTILFTPGTVGTFVGSIDNVTIYALSPSTPELALESSNGSGSNLELRAGGSALYNTFLGNKAGQFNTTGQKNVAIGSSALFSNTTGNLNVANGDRALFSNTSGVVNVAIGNNALYGNTSGNYNVAVGGGSLINNITGIENVALGAYSLWSNTSGSWNTAIGEESLYNNTTGGDNTAIGWSALTENTTGWGNVGVGELALTWNTSGNTNTALGYSAGNKIQTGSNNIFIGYNAGYNSSQKIDAANSIAIGYNSYTTADNQIVLGNTSITNVITSGALNAGGKTGIAYNSFAGTGDSPAATTAITASNDLFVGGDMEIKGGFYLTGKNIFNVVGGVPTGAITFSTDPALINNYNILTNGSWLINNSTNNGIAALMINQAKGGDIFTASASGIPKMTLTNAGNLGIGTTTPAAKLDIAGATSTITNTSGDLTISAASGNISFNSSALTNVLKITAGSGSVSAPTYSFSSDPDTGMYNGGTNILRLATAGSDRVTIDATGNVGIGTTSTSYKLYVQGPNIALVNPSANATMYIGEGLAVDQYSALQFSAGNKQLNIFGSYSGLPIATFDVHNDRVGIGTTNPGAELEVYKSNSTNALFTTSTANVSLSIGNADSGVNHYFNLMLGSAVTDELILYNPSSGSTKGFAVRNNGGSYNRISMFHNDTYGGIQTSGSTPLVLQASGGNVGIGTTTLGEKLTIDVGASNTGGLQITNNNGSGSVYSSYIDSGSLVWMSGVDGSNSSYKIKSTGTTWAAGTDRLTINSSGNVGINYASAGTKLEVVPDATTGQGIYVHDNNSNAGVALLRVGDDSWFTDIDTANTMGVYGAQSASWGYIKTYITAPSSEAYKYDITSLSDTDKSALLDVLNNTDLKLYHLNSETSDIVKHLGVIAEYAPGLIQSREDNTGISEYDYSSLAMFGAKEALAEISSVSGQLANLSLTDTGNLDIAATGTGDYQITNTTNSSVINQIAALGQLIAANIKAGAVVTQDLAANSFNAFQGTVDNMLVKSGLVAGNIQTKMISPLADATNVTIQVGSATQSGKLAVQNAAGVEVASIDSEGNASFSGEVRAKNIDEIQALLTQVKTDQDLLAQAAGWSVNTATDSATISNDQLAISNLYVTNQAAINSLSVSNTLSIGTDLVFQSTINNQQLTMNSIDTLTSPLKIQSLAMAPIEMMAGLIKIDTLGNVFISGNLAVGGRVNSSGLTLKDNQQSTISNEQFATSSALLTLQNSNGNSVATVDASGSAMFNSISTQGLTIAGAVEATNSAIVDGVITTNATAGSGVIPAGLGEITIKNTSVTDYTLVYVTPTSSTNNYVLYVKSKAPGEFVVGFTNPIDIDVNFNWWIVKVSQ